MGNRERKILRRELLVANVNEPDLSIFSTGLSKTFWLRCVCLIFSECLGMFRSVFIESEGVANSSLSFIICVCSVVLFSWNVLWKHENRTMELSWLVHSYSARWRCQICIAMVQRGMTWEADLMAVYTEPQEHCLNDIPMIYIEIFSLIGLINKVLLFLCSFMNGRDFPLEQNQM